MIPTSYPEVNMQRMWTTSVLNQSTLMEKIENLLSKWKEDGIKDRVGAERYLERYVHSSHLDYTGRERAQALILEKETLIDIFPSVNDFKARVTEWLTYSADD